MTTIAVKKAAISVNTASASAVRDAAEFQQIKQKCATMPYRGILPKAAMLTNFADFTTA